MYLKKGSMIETVHILKALKLFPMVGANGIVIHGIRKVSTNCQTDLTFDEGQMEAMLSKISLTESFERKETDDNFELVNTKYSKKLFDSLINSSLPLSPKARNALQFAIEQLFDALIVDIKVFHSLTNKEVTAEGSNVVFSNLMSFRC